MAEWSEVSQKYVIESKRLDAEFYGRHYIESLNKVKSVGSKTIRQLGINVVSGPFGSSLKSTEYLNEGIPFIRILDLKDFFISNEQLVYISNESNNRISSSQIVVGDLILSKVGNTIGVVSILDDDYDKANISENNIGIRFSDKHTTAFKKYILTYLNSLYGQNEILRRRSGNAQPKLNVSDIYDIEVPIISEDNLIKIEQLIDEAEEKNKLSKSLYEQAKKTFENELGLDKLVFKTAKIYEASFSEVLGKGRIDADHYQVQYKQIKELIKNYHNGFQPLLQIAHSLSPNINPRKKNDIEFKYIELSNINPSNGMVDGFKLIEGKLAPSRAKRQVSCGDVIASAVVGSVDKAGIVDETEEGALASTGFFHFRSKGCSPYYLLLLIRSKPVQMQLIQEATGGILSAVPDNNLKNIIIPKIEASIQEELSNLVENSHRARIESANLLARAKKMVEELIEEGRAQ